MWLNEGLERLGDYTFSGSAIENIILPSTLKKLEYNTFYDCKNLKSIEIPWGVEYIGWQCFQNSGIEEITLPSTLKGIDEEAFKNCYSLRTVWVENGCTIDIREYVNSNVKVCRE